MKRTNLSLGEKLLIGAFVVGNLHFIDHVLRVDHSGWPFTDNVSPLTFVIPAVYLLFAIIWFNRSRPWLRVLASCLLLVVALPTHTIIIEPPQQIFGMWAHNHSAPALLYPGNPDVSNALDIQSPLLGVISVTIALSLVMLSLAMVVVFTRESRRSTVVK